MVANSNISQSNSGKISGGQQAAIGSHITQDASLQTTIDSQPLTQAEIVSVLANIEQIIQNAELPENIKNKAVSCIKTAKLEAKEEEPDKRWLSQNLEKVRKDLQEADQAAGAVQQISQKIFPLLIKVAGWLSGISAAVL